jgi:hypothetical protein
MLRASWALAWIVTASLFLAGCGGNEGQQRAAFTEFLQTRILDKPGIHVPKLTDEEKASFGPYADHYAVITDFNTAMDDSVSPKLKAAMEQGAIRFVSDVAGSRARLEAARTGINEMGSALSTALAQADAAHAKLDQPADLKATYDKAYARLVTEPAAVFRDIVPVMDKVLGEAIDLGQYIDEHRASVRLNGPMIETSSPAIQSAINEKLSVIQSDQQAVQSAQSRVRSIMYGN